MPSKKNPIKDREQAAQKSGDYADNDADLILWIKVKNDIDATDYQQAQEELLVIQFCAKYQRFNHRCKKSNRRKAHQCYRNISVFNTAVKSYPMQCGNKPHSKDGQTFFKRNPFNSLH